MGTCRRGGVLGCVQWLHVAGGDASNAVDGLREVVPRNDAFVREVVDARHDALVDGGKDGHSQVAGVGRSAHLVEDDTQFWLLLAQTNHCLHKVVAKGGVEPCGADDEVVLAVRLHAFLASQFRATIHRVGTSRLFFRHRLVACAVKDIVGAHLHHASSSLAHRFGQIARSDVVQQIAQFLAALRLIHSRECCTVHDAVNTVLFYKSLHFGLVGDVKSLCHRAFWYHYIGEEILMLRVLLCQQLHLIAELSVASSH